MKAGDWVLAIGKSAGCKTYKEFLEVYPLGVAKIDNVKRQAVPQINLELRDVISIMSPNGRMPDFAFIKKDLILLKEADERETKKVWKRTRPLQPN